ncbi:cadmium-translocating P-type ATPase [Bacillus sp. BRMEA1]|uniref:heavy metal translocating P-type ATPase n=1 Tax=Neobacillus endophyticus TaxID=2738405 RepID=UPI001566D8F6|nr:heavy metal translocating P-type ATPase [Neobacillus endophyticus]NRD80951.1 cadmium-translocating P-type ATPase [Neobacillus endophyticus]
MNNEVQTITKNMSEEQVVSRSSVVETIRSHYELIFALVSGVFILIGWLSEHDHALFVSTTFYLLAFCVGGYAKAKEGIQETLAEKELNVEMLMIIAAIGSAIIGYWAEGAILIFIFSLSGALESYTLNKSQKEISALFELQPEEALRLIDGKEEKVTVDQLQIGDRILIKPGDRIAVDGIIIRGETHIDESAITGESVPNGKKTGDEVFAGTVNIRGSIEVEMTQSSDQTLFQRIIRLVQSAQSEKSPSQLFIEKFEGTYVKVVLIIVGMMMFIPHYALEWSWNETLYRAMILLVVASPCALVASITPAALSAISNGARHGILFKGSAHLEQLASLQAIAFDKTGTLTMGKPIVTDIFVQDGISKEDLLLIAASIENHSTHPLADSIVNYVKNNFDIELRRPEQVEDITGFGLKGKLDGKSYKIGKGDFIGEEAKCFHPLTVNELSQQGKTIVYIADHDSVLGFLALKDVIRDETVEVIRELNTLGIKTIMITGDNEQTAKVIAEESQISEYYASCLPETKVETVKVLKEKYKTVAMVGDGINDAPALATANVGIAMGGGTDVALETADVVLMKNELFRLGQAIRLSKRMNRIVKQNIILSLTIIALLICSNFLQLLALPFGVIGHEGSTLLVILNGLRLLKSDK